MKEKDETAPKLETRKHKALRRTLIFLIVLALYQGLHTGGLTPLRGTRYAEESLNCGRTKVVERLYKPEKKLYTSLFYLTENENVTLLSRSQLYPVFGWLDGGWNAVDCSKPQPLYMGSLYLLFQDDPQSGSYLTFGRVDDPEIAAVEVVYQARSYMDDPGLESSWTELARLRTERPEWTEQRGRTYFLLDLPEELRLEEDTSVEAYAAAYDAEGRELGRYDVGAQTWHVG